MAATKPYFSNRSGITYIMVDQSTVPDGVRYHTLPDTFVYESLIEGPYRAVIVCEGTGDETGELQPVFDYASVDHVVIDSGITITINGTLTCAGKRLTIKPGSRLEGTGTINGAIFDFNWYDDAIDSALTLTGCTFANGTPIYTADATADARGHRLYYNGTTNKLRLKISSTWTTVSGPNTVIPLILDNGGAVLATGKQYDFVVPFDCVVTGWTIVGEPSGSIVVDLWQDTYANYPPTVADTITGSQKPTITTAVKGQNLAISPTWTLTKDSVIRVYIDSVTTITSATVNLHVTKS
jgi:hypothetical protein